MKLNKQEKYFYNNIPNCAKVYYRNEIGINILYWNIFNGECDDLFERIENINVLRIIYFRS